MKKLLHIFCFFILTFCLFSEDVQLTISASKTLVNIGDRVDIRLIATSDIKFDRIEFDIPKGGYEVLENDKKSKLKEEGGKYYLSRSFQIAFFNTGSFSIGPLKVSIYKGSDKICEKFSNIIDIDVQTLLKKDDNNIEDIKSPQGIDGNPMYLLKYLIPLILLLILLFVFWKFFKREKKTKKIPVQLTPLEQFMKDIHILKGQNFLAKQQFRLFYYSLSDIAKTFLSDEHVFNASDLTSYEILEYLSLQAETKSFAEYWKKFFNAADMVKYAKHNPDKNFIDNLDNLINKIEIAYKNKAREERNVSNS